MEVSKHKFSSALLKPGQYQTIKEQQGRNLSIKIPKPSTYPPPI
uniref:Uncharacterized protein n=1 Tax=Arundo donax TaxID=35708 RepID=A0A0A8YK90_ARUDO